MDVQCGDVVQVVFPLSSASPVFTVVSVGDDVWLESMNGKLSSLPTVVLRHALGNGACAIVAPTVEDVA